MEEWKKYFDEASAYSKTALGAFNKNRLGNHVIYNLIGLAVENYLTAICMKFDIFPEHSSIGSMIHLLKGKIEIPDTFKAESRFMNKFMNFCSLEVLDMPEPRKEDLERMLGFTNNVKRFTEKVLLENFEVSIN